MAAKKTKSKAKRAAAAKPLKRPAGRSAVKKAASKKAWSHLSSDGDLKKLHPDGRIPMAKLRLDIPEGTKRVVAIIACGSFSPPTNAHCRLLEDARDSLEAKGVHVIGGFMSPVHIGYGKKSLVQNYHRVNLVGATLQHNDWIEVDPWECCQDGWTLTALVIDRYQAEFDELYKNGSLKQPVRVSMVGGADLMESFSAIKDDGTPVWSRAHVEKIVSRGFICIARASFNLDEVISKDEILARYKDNIDLVVPSVENNISSTLIRKNLLASRSIKYLVPDDVINYIQLQRLQDHPAWS
jgi:nicotinate (nicotinamide) nucleotide adenylyltransferase